MKIFNKVLLIVIALLNFTVAVELKPEKQMKLSGGILDFVYYNGKIFASTEKGTVEVIDLKTWKLEKKVELPKFQDFMGGYQPPKVFSADVIGNNLAAVCESTGGNRDLYLKDEKGSMTKVNITAENLQYTKIRFWGENYIVIITKGSEVILYDVKNKKIFYRKQIGSYSFGDFTLCDNKKFGVLADEGGTAYLIDVSTGKILRKYDKVNVDQIYRVDCRAGKIITGGRDRRIGYYDINTGNYKKIEADFIVFSIGLSLDGRLAAYQLNEGNDLAVYDFSEDRQIATLKGHRSTVGIVNFISENVLVSGSDDGKIMLWRIKR